MNYPSFEYSKEDIEKYSILNKNTINSIGDIITHIEYKFANRYDYIHRTTKDGGTYSTYVEPLHIQKDGIEYNVLLKAAPNAYCKPTGLHKYYTHFEVDFINKVNVCVSDVFEEKYKNGGKSYRYVSVNDIATEIYNFIYDIDIGISYETKFVKSYIEKIRYDGAIALMELNEILDFEEYRDAFIGTINYEIEKFLESSEDSFTINLYNKFHGTDHYNLMIYHQQEWGRNVNYIYLLCSDDMSYILDLDDYKYSTSTGIKYYANVPIEEAIEKIYKSMLTFRDILKTDFGEI